MAAVTSVFESAAATQPPALPVSQPARRARLAVVDVLDRDGRARHSLDVHHWPVRIGRALDNDLVVDDPSMAAHHLQLAPADDAGKEGQPQVWLTVGDTRNGVQVGRKTLKTGQAQTFASEQEWQAGQTRFRIRLAGAELPAEQTRSVTTAGSVIAILAGVAGVLGLTVLNSYLTTAPGDFLAEVFKELMAVSLVFAAWPLVWALVSKMFRHRMFFWQHVKIATWVSIVLQLASYLLAGLAFAFSLPLLHKLRPELVWLALAAVLYGHLAVVLPRHRRLLGGVALAFLVGLQGTSMFMRHAEEGRWLKPLYMGDLPHPALRVAQPQTVSGFMQLAAGMESGLQAEAQKKGFADEEDDEAAEE